MHNVNLIEKYQVEFEKLWVQFAPFKLNAKESKKKVDAENKARTERIQAAKEKK